MHPALKDFFILTVFTILITFHPYYLHGEINIYELGLYLPGIKAILNGQIPFRDFFHLRGPLELYLPAFFMTIFGEKVSVLATYFYVGTVLTLILCILIGQRLYKERLILYLMVPVLIGRTFPRVVFTFWGGVRYCLGLLSVLLMIKFFESQHDGSDGKSSDRRPWKWILGAGTISFLSFITSAEIGFCSFLGIAGALIFSWKMQLMSKAQMMKSFFVYFLGLAVLAIPYGSYLIATGSLLPYLKSTYIVAVNMQKVINLRFISPVPSNVLEAMAAMVMPFHENFRHMTPIYLYLIFLSYLIFMKKQKRLMVTDQGAICLAIYGFTMYVLAFRNIGGYQFEMALQPEKILLFYLLQKFYVFVREKKKDVSKEMKDQKISLRTYGKIFLIYFLLVGFFGSSLGIAIYRYNHRFFVFKWAKSILTGQDSASLSPLAGEKKILITSGPAEGMTVPITQAQDFEQLTKFIQEHTTPDEPVLMFPDIGFYSFLVDRNSVGRFPITIFSWFDEGWHKEFVSDLRKTRPRYAVVLKTLDSAYESVYFKVPQNKYKFLEIMQFINEDYIPITSTPNLIIYQRKELRLISNDEKLQSLYLQKISRKNFQMARKMSVGNADLRSLRGEKNQ